MMKNPIDRPFRSREDVAMEQALVAQYRQIGNSELLAAIASEVDADADDNTDR